MQRNAKDDEKRKLVIRPKFVCVHFLFSWCISCIFWGVVVPAIEKSKYLRSDNWDTVIAAISGRLELRDCHNMMLPFAP